MKKTKLKHKYKKRYGNRDLRSSIFFQPVNILPMYLDSKQNTHPTNNLILSATWAWYW